MSTLAMFVVLVSGIALGLNYGFCLFYILWMYSEKQATKLFNWLWPKLQKIHARIWLQIRRLCGKPDNVEPSS